MRQTGELSHSDVMQARERIRGYARVTPLVESARLNERLGGRLLFKLEALQVGGAFKFRGALNAILGGYDEHSAGVVAFSSGNHAIAVSTAAALMRIPAAIVMPGDAPAIKIEQTRATGAEVVLYDRDKEDRTAIGRQIVRERGYQLIAPFDNPYVIAGQGTIALEIVEQATALCATLDSIAIPCSGGGLASGCALALSGVSPGTTVTTVEPDDFDDMAQSLDGDAVFSNTRTSGSICDALLANTPGELTLPILRHYRAKGVSVSDEEVLDAMHTAWRDLKVVLEPGGAAAFAAVLSGRLPLVGRTVAVICSGGNVDEDMFVRALQRPLRS